MESVGWETAITYHSIHTQARSHFTGNGIDADAFPQRMTINYVRVYQK